MARPFVCFSPYRNPLSTGKDEPAGPSSTEGSDTYTLILAMSRAPTLILPTALTLAPAAINSMVRYLEADLQQIFNTVLETRSSALTPQLFVFLDGLCKKPLKARFLELYCGKTHMECYNFIQQYKDHFATARAKKPNRVPFTDTFL